MPALPEIPYATLYRGERRSNFILSRLTLAKECWEFSDLSQIEDGAPAEVVRAPGASPF